MSATFKLALEQVEYEHCAAAAMLHAEAIPEEIFVAGAPHLGPDLAVVAHSFFGQAVAILQKSLTAPALCRDANAYASSPGTSGGARVDGRAGT